jgi:hypothetical protein
MSDRVQLDLILGPSERHITEQDEGARTALADYYLPVIKGVRRSVVFHDCKVRSSDIDLRDEIFDVWVTEQSPDERPYPDAPWKLGAIITTRSPNPLTGINSSLLVSLCVLPMMFQQFWEMAEAPATRAVVHIDAHREATILFVFGIRMEVRARQHPVVAASEERWRVGIEVARWTFRWLIGAAVVFSLTDWIIRSWWLPVREALLRFAISQTVDGGRSISAMGPWGETLVLGLMLVTALGAVVIIAALVFQLAPTLRRAAQRITQS